MAWLSAACAEGARREAACRAVGLSVRTWQRWQRDAAPVDGRYARPCTDLPTASRTRSASGCWRWPIRRSFAVCRRVRIVPALADRGEYLASESTFYRVLRAEGQAQHRGRARPPTQRTPQSHRATAPNQLWSWDITYLATTVQGMFFYLYLILDVYSRKIVGLEVFEAESAEHATTVVGRAYLREGIAGQPLVLHSDNGAPMKGATLLATLQKLGVVPSFSRPSVSNDNPYSEALFRTLKYVPSYSELARSRQWSRRGTGQRNSSTGTTRSTSRAALKFVTPGERHRGEDAAVLARRRTVYATAQLQHPERWSGRLRNWEAPKEVWLNPPKHGRRLTPVTPL